MARRGTRLGPAIWTSMVPRTITDLAGLSRGPGAPPCPAARRKRSRRRRGSGCARRARRWPGGKILGPMFHRARRHVAGEDGDAAVDLEQDLAGVEAVVLGQPVDDVVGDAGVGALCPEPRTAGVNYR